MFEDIFLNFDSKHNVFNLFDKQWALVVAGNIYDFNGCTIGWGSLGNIWGNKSQSKPIVTIYVHPKRYTAEYLMREECFSISFFSENYREDLIILGKKSGRFSNKFIETKLTPKKCNNCVIFEEAKLTFLCRKLYWEQFNPLHLVPEIRNQYFNIQRVEPHYQFIGEITELF